MMATLKTLISKIRLIFNYNINSPNASKIKFIYILLFFLSAFGLEIFTLLLSTGEFGLGMFYSYFHKPLILLLNFLPIFLILILLYFVLGKAWLSFLITSTLSFGFSLVNHWKLNFRNDPLYFEDLVLVKDAAQISRRYNISLELKLILFIISILIGIFILYLLLPAKPNSKKLRLTVSISILTICIAIMKFIYLNPAVYSYASNNNNINIWSGTQNYISRGFMYPFLNSASTLKDPKPQGYSISRAKNILKEYDDHNLKTKPNIICIMLEAYSDLSTFDSLKINDDVYSTWNNIKNESYSGNLISNVFAGGTYNTERYFITGFESIGSFRVPSWSYARYFKSQGYNVEGMHPSYQWFYNRVNINPNLGFDKYMFKEDYFDKLYSNGIAPDNILFPEILSRYKKNKAESNSPYFNFSVTYQNHGPYDTKKTYFGNGHILNQNISNESRIILDNYLGGIRETQTQIKIMLDELKNDDQPVIVVLFGDHKPWLGDNNSVYKELNMHIEGNDDAAIYNYYQTPYLIWGNVKAKELYNNKICGKGKDMSPSFLMNETFSLMNEKGPAFCQQANIVKKKTPVISEHGFYEYNNKVVKTLPKNVSMLLNEYAITSYYLRKDYMRN